jgi:hypothetical protein
MTVIKRFCILHRPILRDCLGNVTMPARHLRNLSDPVVQHETFD